MFLNLDKFYNQCSFSNKIAYNDLLNWFLAQGISIAIASANTKGIINVNKEEIKVQLTELYLISIRTFNLNEIPYYNYALFLIRKRMITIIDDLFKRNNEISLDENDESGNKLIDYIESDDYSKMNIDLQDNSKMFIIGSKKIKTVKIDSRINKYLELKDKGYSRDEIMKTMRLSDGQYRYMIRIIHDYISGKQKIDLN